MGPKKFWVQKSQVKRSGSNVSKTRMKLHFFEAVEIENLKEVESERKQKQQDQIALFEKKSLQRDLPKKILCLERIGPIWSGMLRTL